MTIRMRALPKVLAAMAIALGGPVPWGYDGHWIVGAVAWRYLDPPAQAAVLDLLDGKRLADVASWADEVKKDREEQHWHWLNVPRPATSVGRDAAAGENVVGAIERYSVILGDSSASRRERSEALKYLVHYVGDVHQPLHVSYADDAGGNRVAVEFFGDETDLHSVWDTGILRRHNDDRAEFAGELLQSITPERLAVLRVERDPVAWANESLALTRQIYADLPGYRGRLLTRYQKAHVAIVERRLVAAGVRLAALLNRILGGSTAPAATPVPLHIAFWNVENLFDLDDDPRVDGDEEFTPAGSKEWSEQRLETKYQHMARVIDDMNHGRGPDVLGLCEVENREVLRGLLPFLHTGRDYAIVHQDSPSDRGIDCALLFDPAVLSLRSSAFFFVDADNTRDIVRVEFVARSHPLTVFVNHWPSRGGDREGTGRKRAARVLRAEIDKILTLDPAADVVVLGDFNDEPDDASIAGVLRALRAPAGEGDLLNTMWEIHTDENLGSYCYRGKWQTLDQLIVSPGLRDPDGFSWVEGSTTVIRQPYQMFHPGKADERPDRTYGGDRYYGGYSDHLPVCCQLRS